MSGNKTEKSKSKSKSKFKYNRKSILPEMDKDIKRAKKGKSLEFQLLTFLSKTAPYIDEFGEPIVECYGDDYTFVNSLSICETLGEKKMSQAKRYIPQMIGVMPNGASITVNVYGFGLYIFAKIPKGLQLSKEEFLDKLHESFDTPASKWIKHHILNVEVKKMSDFRYFNNFQKQDVFVIIVDHETAYRRVCSLLERGLTDIPVK